MLCFTLQQHVENIKIRYKNGDNLAEMVHKTKTLSVVLKHLVGPQLMTNLLEQVSNVKNKICAHRSRKTAVSQGVEEIPDWSSAHRYLELDIPQTS